MNDKPIYINASGVRIKAEDVKETEDSIEITIDLCGAYNAVAARELVDRNFRAVIREEG